MRAVADTNVYISALKFSGTADEVLTLGRAQAIQLFISPSILQSAVLSPESNGSDASRIEAPRPKILASMQWRVALALFVFSHIRIAPF